MLLQPIKIDAALKDAFEDFRQEPYNRFVINVRRTRAAQIRKLLSSPSSIDLKTFTDEIWNFETQTLWRSKNLPIAVFKETRGATFVEQLIEAPLLFDQQVTWENLEAALGNGTWNYMVIISGIRVREVTTSVNPRVKNRK